MYVPELLNETHQLAAFDCGKPELNLWLQNSAHHAQRMRTCSTTVWHTADGVVVAYYGLVAHVIERADLSSRAGRGNPDRIPAVLLARLALDQNLHGLGLGGPLLAHACERIVAAAQQVGARFAVVDAIDDEAAKFYQHYGFEPTPAPHRLVRKISHIAAELDAG